MSEAAPSDARALPDPDACLRALGWLPARPAQLLSFRFVDRRSAEEAAALYGVKPDAFLVQQLRAARLLRRAIDEGGLPISPAPVRLHAPEERALAEALERAVSEGAAPDGELGRMAGALRRLAELGPEVRKLAAARAREEEASPERRRADWGRRIALVALVALAVWLYLRSR